MSDPVRIGFIGCGGHATQNLYPSFRLGVRPEPEVKRPTPWRSIGPDPEYACGELVACCDLQEDLAKRNARNFGFQRYYTDHREMLEKEDLDAVFAVMHPRDQPRIAIDVLNSGRPVFVEKPSSVTIEDSLAMKEAAEKNGQWVMIAFMKRFSAPYLRAKRVIQDPAFGPPSTFEARYMYGQYPPYEVYDFINGFSCHVLDLARFFMGDVKAVYAAYISMAGAEGGRPLTFSEVSTSERALPQEESWLISVEFENGGIGSIHTGCLERLGERVQVAGRGSFVEITNWREVRTYLGDPETESTWEPNETLVSDAMDLRTFHGYTGEIVHFLNCVDEGKKPSVSIDDGIAQLRIEQACKKSALERRVVEITEIPV